MVIYIGLNASFYSQWKNNPFKVQFKEFAQNYKHKGFYMGQLHTYIYGYNQIIDNLQQIYNKTKNINKKTVKISNLQTF